MYKNIFIFILVLIPFTSFAQWDDCPFGETDGSCESPGQCGRYTDTDENEICDHSQPDPTAVSANSDNTIFDEHDVITGKELKTKTVGEVASLYDIDKNEYAKLIGSYLNTKVSSKTSFQLLHDNYDLEPSKAKDIALSLRSSKYSSDVNEASQGVKTVKAGPRYPLGFLVIITILAYGITYILVKQKIITMLTHRKIWNMVLMINFLASAILGILLVFQINWGARFDLSFNILYWHVITGIIMAIVCIFHITWHWRYYKNIFKKN